MADSVFNSDSNDSQNDLNILIEPTTFRHYLGNPELPPLSEIPDEQVRDHLNALLDSLYSHGIAVHCKYTVEDHELYRFIVDELLDQQMSMVQFGPQRFWHAIIWHIRYEHYHPTVDPIEQVRSVAYLVVGYLFSGRMKNLLKYVADHGVTNNAGGLIEREDFIQVLDRFVANVGEFDEPEAGVTDCSIKGKSARVELDVYVFNSKSSSYLRGEWKVTISLRQNESGEWKVTGADGPWWKVEQ